MRVLHIIPSMTVAYGGPSHALSALTDVLSEDQNTDLDIVTVGDEREDNVEAKVCVKYFRKTWPYNFYISFPLFFWLRKNLEKYDVVHIHSLFSFPSYAGSFFSKKYKVPYIIRPFGTLDAISRKHHSIRKSIYYYFIEKKNLVKAAYIHLTSEQELREFKKLSLKTPFVVIPLGIFLPEKKAAAAKNCLSPQLLDAISGKKVLLSLSRINPRKGIEILIEAFSRVKESVKDVILVIAGEGPPAYVGGLKRRAQALNVADSIFWCGIVRGEEKEVLLDCSTAFVLLSRGESFGLSVVEAMSKGVPVLISDQVAIQTEVSDADAGSVTSLDTNEVVVKMLELLGDKTVLRRKAHNALKLAEEKYNIKLSANRILNLYEELAPKKNEK